MPYRPFRPFRRPNMTCDLEREIYEKWSGNRSGWQRFCGQMSPTDAQTCCLPPNHGGHVHITFSIEPRILMRWTEDGRIQE